MEDEQTCWICLCGPDAQLDTAGGDEDDQCVRVCACPRVCHKRCLGRWQLQNAGKREEKYCRFCHQRYPDWRNSLTPGEITPSTPVMAVSVRGKVYKLRVRSGPEGKEDFKRQIRQLLGFTQDMDFDVIFECKTPHNGSEKVQLHGFEAFEAASWCAAVSAAKRKKAKQEAAARAAAAAAAAAASCAGSLTPTASCPAALTVPESNTSSSSTQQRPSSSGSSSGVSAGGGSSSDGSSESAADATPDVVHGAASPHDMDTTTMIAPSAFATATAAAAAGCPAGGSTSPILLASHASTPQPMLTNTSGNGLGMFGLQPAESSLLQTAGSSMPHAIVEAQLAAADAAARHPAASSSSNRHRTDGSVSSTARRSSSCPGEGAATRQHHHRHHAGAAAGGSGSGGRSSYSSGVGLQSSPSSGSHSDGGQGGEEGGEGGRGKVGRWLRRVLHLEGPWRGPTPASVFMGVV